MEDHRRRLHRPWGQETEIISSKAITSNVLYGYVHESTREWKDGQLSRTFCHLALLSKTKKNSKKIILDGTIDAEWIESLNTTTRC